MRAALIGLAALTGLAASPAAAERLVLSLSTNTVTIGSNYTGARLVAFGVIERDGQSATRAGAYEVVVTVRGPREALTIRRKEQLGPIWLNRSQKKFVQVPAFLQVLSSRPVAEIMDAPRRARFRLGMDAVIAAPEFTLEPRDAGDAFTAALLRLKRRDALYAEEPRGVTLVTETFLRAPIVLPATSPVGGYDVEVTLIADGVVVARRDANFEVVKTGFEDGITELSRDRPLAIGLTTAGLSLLFGWLASVIFRRD